MNQLKLQNQGQFQQINQMMSMGTDPSGLIKQLAGRNPQQIQSVLGQAKQMGAPDNVLAQIQNLIR